MVGDRPAPTFDIEWPAEYVGLIEPMRDAWGVDGDIVLVRRLGGLSGSRVFIADVVATGFSGRAILKLSDDADEDAAGEATRQTSAAAVNPDFGRSHLPNVVASLDHDGRSATLSTIAGRGLQYITPWDDCGFTQQLTTGRQVSCHGTCWSSGMPASS